MPKKKKIKLISWNVNGIRAVVKKDFFKLYQQMDADIFAIQETKLQAPQITDEMKDVEEKGYSGVCTYTRIKPKRINHGIGEAKFDNEGRIIEMDFGDFVFFNVYFPNGQMSEERLRYKLDFYEEFFKYADAYKNQGRSLIIAGDYNTAHNEIDLKNSKANEKTSGFLTKANEKTSGFLRIERDWLDRIIENGYIDTYRYFNPDAVKYSWWTYRFKAREHFFVTKDIIDKGWVKEAFIDNDIFGSDHCPVGLVIEI